MSYDITHLLYDWDFQTGQVVARQFKGKDGRQKVQLRVDLGILQMNIDGRPDGKRPLGFDSWFDSYRSRVEKLRSERGPEKFEFELGPEDCAKLQQEAIQYHHRYICLFQLEDYEGVVRDCNRNLEVFAFANAFAANEELAWSLNQFAPQLYMMRTRAQGMTALRANEFASAEKFIETGIEELEGFYRENNREELLDQSSELASLRAWIEDVRAKRPLSDLERLQRQLEEAIQVEDYEKAAKVRDELRKLDSSKS